MSRCIFCDERQPAGGFTQLVLAGKTLTFCESCADKPVQNKLTGQQTTLAKLAKGDLGAVPRQLDASRPTMGDIWPTRR